MINLGPAFIHIGLEKTGSTFLQEFLELNDERLVNLGLYKSKVFDYANHYRLALLGQDKNSAINHVNNICQIPVESVEDSNNRFLNQIIQLHSSESRFLASSELISSFVHELSEIERFKNNLGSVFAELKILLFIRRQERLIISRHTTEVIHGFDVPFPSNTDDIIIRSEIDLITKIDRWKAIFGKNLVVLPYFEDFNPRDLINRFFHSLGILETELTDFVWPQNVINSGMSATGLATLRKLNEKIEKIPDELRKQIVSYVKEKTNHEGQFAVPESFHEQLVTKFMSINEQASSFLNPSDRERFLHGQSLNTKTSTIPNFDLLDELLVQIVSLFYDNNQSISQLLLE